MIELLMTDIDGCVLSDGIPHDQVAFFQNASNEIRNYIQTDGSVKMPPIVFCTGRGSEYVHALSQILDTRFGLPSIVENGSYLFWPENRRIVPHPCLFDKESMVAEIKRLLLRNVVKKDIADIIHGKEGSVSLKSTKFIVAELKIIV